MSFRVASGSPDKGRKGPQPQAPQRMSLHTEKGLASCGLSCFLLEQPAGRRPGSCSPPTVWAPGGDIPVAGERWAVSLGLPRL